MIKFRQMENDNLLTDAINLLDKNCINQVKECIQMSLLAQLDCDEKMDTLEMYVSDY